MKDTVCLENAVPNEHAKTPSPRPTAISKRAPRRRSRGARGEEAGREGVGRDSFAEHDTTDTPCGTMQDAKPNAGNPVALRSDSHDVNTQSLGSTCHRKGESHARRHPRIGRYEGLDPHRSTNRHARPQNTAGCR